MKKVTQQRWYLNSGCNCVTSVTLAQVITTTIICSFFTLCQWLPCLLIPVANKSHLGLRSTSGSKITQFHI